MPAPQPSLALNWPNALTLSRPFLGAFCLWFLTLGTDGALLITFALMLVAEATDFLDGFIARATNSVTALGKIIDPMADSMYRLTIFAGFVQLGWMPAWMFAILMGRDFAVAYFRIIAISRNLPVAARISGKAKALTQGVAQVVIVGAAAFGLEALSAWRMPLLALAALMALLSLFDYASAMLRPPKR